MRDVSEQAMDNLAYHEGKIDPTKPITEEKEAK